MAYDKNRGGGWFGWALIVFCFMSDLLAPLGLVLLLIKIFGSDERKRKKNLPPPKPKRPDTWPTPGAGTVEAQGRVMNDGVPERPGVRSQSQVRPQPQSRPQSQPGAQPQVRPQPQSAVNRAASAAKNVTKSPVPKKANARLLKAGGVALLILGLMSSGSALSDAIWALGGEDFTAHLSWLLPELLQSLAMMGGGGVLLGTGVSMGRGLKRYAKYLSVMGERDAMPVGELARTLGIPERRVGKDLQKMIDKGYFGGKAYLNVEYGLLFRSDEAAERFRKTRAAIGKEQAPKEVEEGYSGILRNIRRANDAIADPILSAKIDRLEEIAGKIFLAVEEDPQKRGKIDTFLNYYLPTTQKLLDSYAEFEAAGVEGENLRQAKQRIQTTMDTVVKGFEHQLDELYRTDVLDVDSDIQVLETMLRWETASAAQDFGTAAPGDKPQSPGAQRIDLVIPEEKPDGED